MRKSLLLLLMLVTGVLTSAAVTVTVDVDDASRVTVYKQLSWNSEISDYDTEDVEPNSDGKFVIEGLETYKNVYVKPVDGYRINSMTSETYGVSAYQSGSSYYFYHWSNYITDYTVNVKTSPIIYDKHLNVKIDNPEGAYIMTSEYREIHLTETESIVDLSDTESYISIQPTDYNTPLYQVYRGGELLSSSGNTYYLYDITDGENIEIKADFPDEDVTYSIKLKEGSDEGINLSDLIYKITVDGEEVSPENFASFPARLGKKVEITFLTTDYNFWNSDKNTSYIYINGTQTSFYSGIYSATVFADTEIELYVSKKPTCEVKIYVEDGNSVAVYKDYGQKEENKITLHDGENILELPQYVYVYIYKASDEYFLTGVFDNNALDKNLKYNDYAYIYVNGEAGYVIDAKKLIRDKKFTFYANGYDKEKYNYSSLRFTGETNRSDLKLANGYQATTFCEEDGEIELYIYSPTNNKCYVYLNGEAKEYNYSIKITPNDGDVLKAYFCDEEPEPVNVTFAGTADADGYKVVADYITTVDVADNSYEAFPNTYLRIYPANADKPIRVYAGETELKPVEEDEVDPGIEAEAETEEGTAAEEDEIYFEYTATEEVTLTIDYVLPAETPTFSVAEGAVERGTTVELACTTEGAKIYYTLDGSEPTAESTEYTEAITIDEAVTIKAIAIAEGFLNSAVATASYTIKTIPVPEHLYIIGTVDGNGWTPANAIEMTKAEKTFTYTGEVDGGTDGEGYGYFAFIEVQSDNWNEVNAARWSGAQGQNQEVALDTKTELTYGVDASLKIANGYYEFTVEFSDFEVNLTVVAKEKPGEGVTDITAAGNGAAEYFNLQGIRVVNPAAGNIYIVRRGATVTKELVK